MGINNKREKEVLRKLMKNTFLNFRFNFKEVVVFEIIYRVITTFILIKINLFIMKYFMNSAGMDTITNKGIVNFALTKKGLLCISIILLLSFCMMFFEIGVLTYIGAKSHKGEKARLLDSIFHSFQVLKDTFDIGIIKLIIIVGVIGPLTGLGLCSSLIRKLSIPPFVIIELEKTTLGKVLIVGVILIIIIFLLRWALSIPIVVIEKIKGKQGIKNSTIIYKKNKGKLLKAFVLWVIVSGIFFLLSVVLIWATGILGKALCNGIGVNGEDYFNIMTIIIYVSYVVVTLISTPLFISYLVELYYELRCYSPIEREFKKLAFYEESKIYKRISKFRKPFFIAVIILFVVASIAQINYIMYKSMVKTDVKVTAHRGSSTAPENSLSAVKNAVKEKANYAEIDVQLTKDGQVVLFHDKTLKRINGEDDKIGDLTLEQIQKIEAGAYFKEEYRGEKIPTLNEILEYSKGKIMLNIELKPMDGNEYELAQKVLQEVSSYNMDKDICISSINYKALEDVKRIDPSIETGYIVLAAVGDFGRMNVNFFSVESSNITEKMIFKLHSQGKSVHVFTVNNSKLTEKMVFMGVNNIITDNVPLVKKTITKVNENKNRGIEVNGLQFYYERIISLIKYARI